MSTPTAPPWVAMLQALADQAEAKQADHPDQQEDDQ